MSIELIDIHKSYGSKAVLENFNLTVNRGELITLLGLSGCGKSTTLRIIAGFERPTSGRVMIDGEDVSRLRPSKRDVGLVFQAYSLFPHLTAQQNVEFGLRVRRQRSDARAKQAIELLDKMGLVEHRDKFPHQLSGGQQQRVALARALATEPRVLLLDEPLSALDAQVRVQLREEIRRIQYDTGTTTVLVTHDQEEALTMADRVALMQDGRIEQLGSPQELYRNPATPFVSMFIGVSNRIPVEGSIEGRPVIFGTAVDAPHTNLNGQAGKRVALIRPEDIEVTPDSDGLGMVSSSLLRGPITSLNIVYPGAADPIRVDTQTGSTVSELPNGARVSLTLRTSAVLLDQHATATTGASA